MMQQDLEMGERQNGGQQNPDQPQHIGNWYGSRLCQNTIRIICIVVGVIVMVAVVGFFVEKSFRVKYTATVNILHSDGDVPISNSTTTTTATSSQPSTPPYKAWISARLENNTLYTEEQDNYRLTGWVTSYEENISYDSSVNAFCPIRNDFQELKYEISVALSFSTSIEPKKSEFFLAVVKKTGIPGNGHHEIVMKDGIVTPCFNHHSGPCYNSNLFKIVKLKSYECVYVATNKPWQILLGELPHFQMIFVSY